MNQGYKLREVFNRGMPTVTYVDRSHLKLEESLHATVAKGHAIMAITGPSKCGKTVLRKRVIPDNAAVRVEGGQIGTEDDFWATIRAQLEMPTARTETATKQVTDTTGWNVGLDVGVARAGLKSDDATASTRSATKTFSGAERSQLLRELLDSGKVLVIDDFHYVKEATRASIVRALKAAVFDGLPVVMLSVPYRAFDVLTAEAEMEGRFSHLTIPAWDHSDLVKIGVLGFPVMGINLVRVPADEGELEIIDQLAHESLGSPLLMQSLCAQLCVQLGVFKAADPVRHVWFHEVDLKAVYQSIARDFGLPSFEKLAKGPERGSDRLLRAFANGTKGDIYEAVLAAIALAGAGERITYDEIRSALRSILSGDIPQKHEITRSIVHMCNIARNMQLRSMEQREGETPPDSSRLEMPAIDWKDDVLYLNDVFLRFYLRWVHREKIIPPRHREYDLNEDIPF